MTIERLLRDAALIHQTVGDEGAIPEPPIAVCKDATGLIVLSQEARHIVVNPESLPELVHVMWVAAREGGGDV